MEKLKVNNPRGKYKGSFNVKIIRYSNTDKSEVFCYDEEKYINIELNITLVILENLLKRR